MATKRTPHSRTHNIKGASADGGRALLLARAHGKDLPPEHTRESTRKNSTQRTRSAHNSPTQSRGTRKSPKHSTRLRQTAVKKKQKRAHMIIWIALVLIALWMCLRYLPAGWDAHRPLPELIALIPLLAVPLFIILGISVYMKNFGQIGVTAVLLIIHLLWSATFFIPMTPEMTTLLGSARQTMETATPSTNHGHHVTVMTVNTRYGRADTGTILHEIKQHKVDILAVSEANDDFVTRLHDSGILQTLGYEQIGTKTNHDNAGFNALWSRFPVTAQGGSKLKGMGSNTPWMDVNMSGQTVRILSTHPYSPQRGGEQWGHDISELSTAVQGVDTPVIVMGDMNSSTFHPSLRRVINSGLLDSSLELHTGTHTTFPSSWPLVPSLIEIDHVLHTRELQATSVDAAFIPRTDHKALIVTLKWK